MEPLYNGHFGPCIFDHALLQYRGFLFQRLKMCCWDQNFVLIMVAFYVSLIRRVGVAVDKYLKIYSIWMLMALFQKFISETSLNGEFPKS